MILPPCCATFRPEVDQIVGVFDDIEVVLDGDDGIAHVDRAMENLNQLFDVGKVQAGGRFVEYVKRFAVGFFAQLIGQFDALRFAAGKCIARLCQA